MHLTVARLCLDCQEIHADDRCPVCTSEAFGFITRWVQVDESRGRPRPNVALPSAARVDSYRQILDPRQRRSAGRWLRNGGLAVVAGYLARLGWQRMTEEKPPATREQSEKPD